MKHNLGLAHESLGGTANLRRALASFEDALAVLDTRLHADAWKQAYASLERVEKVLAGVVPGMTRIDHFAALLAGIGLDERVVLVRERVFRLLAQPPPRNMTALAELFRAIGLLSYDDARKIYEAVMKLVIELPQDTQSLSLQALISGHASIEDADAREKRRPGRRPGHRRRPRWASAGGRPRLPGVPGLGAPMTADAADAPAGGAPPRRRPWRRPGPSWTPWCGVSTSRSGTSWASRPGPPS